MASRAIIKPLTAEQEGTLVELYRDGDLVTTIEVLETIMDNDDGITQAQLDQFWREVLRGDVRCEDCGIKSVGRCDGCIIASLDDKGVD